MRIEFRKISKELQAEGMTPELLTKIQSLQVNLPVMFNKGDEPVNVLKASDKEYWVVFPDNTYLKDEKGKLITFPAKDVMIGKLRYYMLHKEEYIEKAIQQKMKSLKDGLKKEVEAMIENYENLYFKAYGKYPETSKVPEFLQNITESAYKHNLENDAVVLPISSSPVNNVRASQKIALQILGDNPQLESVITMLKEALESEDYDKLYITLRSDQLPLLFKAKLNNDKDMAVLKQYFNANALENTLQDLSNHSHLYNVAKFMVLPMYQI